MRFMFEGKLYGLSFERVYKPVTYYVKGKPFTKRSTYPFTTVVLYERETESSLNRTMATVTVGCLPGDKFSNESGRLLAMKGLHQRLNKVTSKEFRAAMWKAYMERGKPPVVEITKPEVAVTNPQLLLGPANPEVLELWD